MEWKSGITGTTSNSYSIGDGKDGYKYIYIDANLGFVPSIRYNHNDLIWEFSNDGYAWESFGSGSAISAGIDGQILTTVSSSVTWSSDLNLSNTGNRSIGVTQSGIDTDGKDLTVFAGTGGTLSSAPGTEGGDLILRGGIRTGSSSSVSDGDIIFKNGSTINGAFSRRSTTEDFYFRLYSNLHFDQTKTPIVSQDANTASIDGYNFTIKAQNAIANYNGGDLFLEGGDSNASGDGYGGSVALIPGSNTGSGKNGNILLNGIPTNQACNNMENGIYIKEASTVPDGYSDASNDGGYLFSNNGALIWKSGVSGTETTMGPGCPHCPRCGRDFATSWSNAGETLSLCMWCLTDTLIELGIDGSKFIIKKEGK